MEEKDEMQGDKEIEEVEKEEDELSHEKRTFEEEDESENSVHYNEIKKLDEMYDATTENDIQLRELIEDRRDLINLFFQKRRSFFDEYETEIRRRSRGLADKREVILKKKKRAGEDE